MHAKRQVISPDPGFEFQVGLLHRGHVEIADQFQCPAAFGRRHAFGQFQIEHGLFAGTQHGRLIDRRQEAVQIHGLPGFQGSQGIGHDDIGRKGIGLGPQTINRPGTHAGKAGNGAARKQFVLGRRVHYLVALARTDDRQVIHAGRQMGEQVGNLDSAFAVFLECPFRAQEFRIGLNELVLRLAKLGGPPLAVEFIQKRLRVKRFELARAAGHEQKNHRPGLGRMMRRFGV